MRVQKVQPKPATTAIFPRATFADAYRLSVDEPALDAITAAHCLFGRAPVWIGSLMQWRNRIVALFGLESVSVGDRALDGRAHIGAFPIVSSTPDLVVLGFDDKHLDFRIVVETLAIEARRSEITATTLVRPHNLLGRTYLAGVLPFHRMIVPSMLAQAART